jgi:hypothetical protein
MILQAIEDRNEVAIPILTSDRLGFMEKVK